MEEYAREDAAMEEAANVEKMLEVITEIHKHYLECDDELLREETYTLLRDSILMYLSQENLIMKFTRPEFGDVLKYNIENQPDLSINGMCQAFEALEKYANNLLLFPWRNEYRTIKLYGGFFKHKVARYLDGVEEIFKLMGYKYIGDSTMLLLGPLNRDKLIEVALNCLIASCECTLIQEFQQLAIGSGCQSTYKEVYKLRNTFNDKDNPYEYTADQPPSFYTSGHKSKGNYSGKREALHREELYEQVSELNRQSVDHETTEKSPDSRDEPLELFQPETHDRHIEASISAVNLNEWNGLSQPVETKALRRYVDTGYKKYDTAGEEELPVQEQDHNDDVALRRQPKGSQLFEENTHRQYDGEMMANRSNYVYPGYNVPHVMAQPQNLNTLIPCQPPTGYRSIYPDLKNQIPPYPYSDVDGNGSVEPRTFLRSSIHDNVRRIEADMLVLNLNDSSSTNKSLSQPVENRATARRSVETGYNKYDVAGKEELPVEEQDDNDDVALRRQPKGSQLFEENTLRQYYGEMMANQSNYVYYPGYNVPHSMVQPEYQNTSSTCQPPTGYCSGYPDLKNQIPSYPYPYVDGNGPVEPRTFLRSSVHDKVSSEYAHERGSDQATPLNSSKCMDDLNEPKLGPASQFNEEEDEPLIDFGTSKKQKFKPDINIGQSKRHRDTKKTPIEVKSREYRSEEFNEKRRKCHSGSSNSDLSTDENLWQCSSCTVLNQPGDEICKICSRSKTNRPEAIPVKSGGRECFNCTYINEPYMERCSVCNEWLPLGNSITYV